MLWTANRWAELFRGLNYVVILGFFAFSAPLFFALASAGILSWWETGLFCFQPAAGEEGKERKRRRGEEER